MKFSLTRSILPILVILAIDLYVFQAVKVVSTTQPMARKAIFIAFWAMTALAVTLLLCATFANWHDFPRFIKTYVFGFIVIFYFSKVVVLPFLLIDDLIRGGKWIFSKVGTKTPQEISDGISITRSQFLMGAGLIAAAIPFSTLVWGIISGPYHFVVRKKKLAFKNFPKAFDGIRILQISDIHTGSWNTTEHMQEAVSLILKQKADMILFTGDLVNNTTDEAYRFMDILKQIQAPMGVYSTLGNHDYGDYAQWDSDAAKKKNMQDMYDTHKKLGWKLLRNEHVRIEKDGEYFALAGVENWGASMRFPKYGDLDKAYKGLEDGPFTLLMSHDPSHWDAKILSHPHHTDLTLAGHTHGMQFGADFKFFRWSPAQWFYKQWADLYQQDKQYIYVNRGLGFLGYPGRVGVMAEITVFTLRSS